MHNNRPTYGRIQGRAGVSLRTRRLATEPLCRDCKAKGNYTLSTVPDHIIPLALGGEDIDSNVRCLCGSCHDRRTAEQFKRRLTPTTGIDGWPL